MHEEEKQQYIVVITIDVCDDINKEDEKTILEKCTKAITKQTGYEAWEVESYRIED